MKTYSPLRKLNITTALGLIVLLTGVATTSLFASATSNMTQTITAGSLSVDMVNGSYVTIGSPTVAMSSKAFSFACLNGGSSSTGTLTSGSQMIYVKNPDAADGGWSVSLAASAPTAFWDGAVRDYDFNDPGTSGCTDDGATTDVDTLGGQMTVTPTGATLAVGTCLSCSTTSVTLGSGGAYNQTSANSVTILTGAAGSDDIGDWKISAGVTISQTIPAEMPADTAYNINMVLSIV